MKPRVTVFTVIGVVAAALALSGCGRKGPLDPPPAAEGATPTSSKSSKPGASLNPLQSEKKTAAPAFDADGKPIANPNAPKKNLPMDWLID